jgi:hypothetical protein
VRRGWRACRGHLRRRESGGDRVHPHGRRKLRRRGRSGHLSENPPFPGRRADLQQRDLC